MDMLTTIMSYVASSALPFSGYYLYTRYTQRNIPKVLANYKSKPDEPQTLGLSVVEYDIPAETEEQYLSRLKTIHSEAWQSYVNDYKGKPILEEQDRFLNLLILKYRNGDVHLEARTHTMTFSDGTEIWTANKYYSFGNIWVCKSRPGMVFSTNDGRLSPYTFMTIVDLENELTDFHTWKKAHDAYTRKRLKSFGSILGK